MCHAFQADGDYLAKSKFDLIIDLDPLSLSLYITFSVG